MISQQAANSLRISQVGLRGVVGSALTAAHVLDFAAAFGTFLEPGGAVVIGRDPRASVAWMMREGLAGWIAGQRARRDRPGHRAHARYSALYPAQGCNASGVSIGASHNSAEWNALKFFGREGTYLSTAEAGELLDIYHLKKFAFVDWTRIGQVTPEQHAIDRYLDDLAAHYDFPALRKFRVLVDCCNGTSSLILRRANQRFGTGFILINERMEGVRFAHDPSTTRDAVALQACTADATLAGGCRVSV